MTILKENLIIALQMAIHAQQDYEKEVLKYTSDSARLAGWKQVFEALQKGETVTISNG